MNVEPTVTAKVSRARLNSIDALRGLIMVIMALDHVRDFVSHSTIALGGPALPPPGLFFTRWITHFCAPVFMLLAGTGAFFYGSRGRTKRELSWFLITRGMWLIVLELTLVRWGWSFSVDYGWMVGQVIWAIGWSMIFLAALVHLPMRWIAAFGIAMIVGHNALDGAKVAGTGWFHSLWAILHSGEPIKIGDHLQFFPLYPLVPWIGVMAAGYALGEVFNWSPERRRSFLIRLGFGMIAAFVALRLPNVYGDSQRWAPQNSAVASLMSILNCSKYPPSLLYLLMTLGPALICLAVAEARPRWTPNWLVIFGRVPMFYYLLHLYLAHFVAGVVALIQGSSGNARWIWTHGPFPTQPDGFGVLLGGVYLIWVIVVALLYPACRWYAGVKERSRNPLLSYL